MILAGVAAGAAALLGSAWAAVAQPLRARSSARTPVLPGLPARLEAHVRMLAATLAPRHPDFMDNLDRSAEYVRERMEAAGGSVSEQVFEAEGKTFRNVIAAFGPETGERIVVGAHYDTFEDSPGADDNASGVAGLLELARMLGEAPPPVRVELVAFAMEEAPFFGTDGMGSAVHATALRRGEVRVRAMIALEMIGCFRDTPGSQYYPSSVLNLFYPTRGDFVMLVGLMEQRALVRCVKRAMRGASPLPVHAICAPRFVEGMDRSDHRSYWGQGYPAVMVTDTAQHRNPVYHTPEDTPDTLDYERMAMVVQGLHAAVWALAAAPEAGR